MAGEFGGISPMQFGYNNPMSFNDPTGLFSGLGPYYFGQLGHMHSKAFNWGAAMSSLGNAGMTTYMQQSQASSTRTNKPYQPPINTNKNSNNSINWEPGTLTNNDLQRQTGMNGALAYQIGTGTAEAITMAYPYERLLFATKLFKGYREWKMVSKMGGFWHNSPFLRGVKTELLRFQAKYSHTYQYVGELDNGFFPYFDYYKYGVSGGEAVSVKTTASGVRGGKLAKSSEEQIIQNMNDLVRVRNAGGMSNKETGWLSVKKVQMDLIVPKNYDINKLNLLQKEAIQRKVPLNIIKF